MDEPVENRTPQASLGATQNPNCIDMDLSATQQTLGAGQAHQWMSTPLEHDPKEQEIDSLLAEEEEELSNLIELHYNGELHQEQEQLRTPDVIRGGNPALSQPPSLYGSDDDEFDDIFRDMDDPVAFSAMNGECDDAMDTSGS